MAASPDRTLRPPQRAHREFRPPLLLCWQVQLPLLALPAAAASLLRPQTPPKRPPSVSPANPSVSLVRASITPASGCLLLPLLSYLLLVAFTLCIAEANCASDLPRGIGAPAPEKLPPLLPRPVSQPKTEPALALLLLGLLGELGALPLPLLGARMASQNEVGLAVVVFELPVGPTSPSSTSDPSDVGDGIEGAIVEPTAGICQNERMEGLR